MGINNHKKSDYKSFKASITIDGRTFYFADIRSTPFAAPLGLRPIPCDFAEASSAKFYIYILLSQIIKKCDTLFI